MRVPTKLKDRYEIKQVLGQGGMGVVYRAYDSVVKRDVALKTLRDSPSPTALQLFFKECDVLASMSHPNIIEIFDIGEFEEDGDNKPFFVMPLLRGASLDKVISGSSQRLTVERCVDIIAQACRGLYAAHENGLVHRDLKPSNLYILDDDSVKVIDFGLAHMVDSRSSTGQKGTLLYMAPEQIEMKPLSPQTDIYALGLTAYEALTRRLPFDRGTVSEIAQSILRQSPPPASEFNPAVNQAVSRVIHKAMAKQPWHRFSNAREFSETLQKALRNEPIEAFDPARLHPRIQRVTKAYDEGDFQLATEILVELEAEGHIDPEITRLRRQIDQATRRKTILQLLDSARRRVDADEYPLALQKIQEVLQIEPDNADALSLRESIERGRTEKQTEEWIRLSRKHLENYGFAHAREALQNALTQDSRDSRALELLAEVDRKEREYHRELQEKNKLYESAMEDYHRGEFSTALSKLQRVLELDRRAPGASPSDPGASLQNFYNQVRSEYDAINHAYEQARTHLANRNFVKALAICEEFLVKYPGHALFQAMRFDVQEQQRQQLSSYIVEVDRLVEAEPDLERRVSILKDAIERYPEEAHFQSTLRLMRDKRDLVNSIVAKARQFEERSLFGEALGQWEILRTIHRQYPGLDFEIERVKRRREQQSRQEAKARWVQQIDERLDLGDYAAAGELLERALSEFSDDAELSEMGNVIHQAKEARERAQQLAVEGRELCEQERFDEGIEALRKAQDLDPQNTSVRLTLVEMLAQQARSLIDTDWHAAEALLQQASELDPNHPLIRSLRTLIEDRKREEFEEQCSTRARQLQGAGDLEGALGAVEEGLAAYPQSTRLAQLRSTLMKALPESKRSQSRFSALQEGKSETGTETEAFSNLAASETAFMPAFLSPPAAGKIEEAAEIVTPAPEDAGSQAPESAAPPPASTAPASPLEVASTPPPEAEPVAAELTAPEEDYLAPARSSSRLIAGAGAVAALIIIGIVGYSQGWVGTRGTVVESAQPQPAQPEPVAAGTTPPPAIEPPKVTATPKPEPPVAQAKQQPPPSPPARATPTPATVTMAVDTTPSGASVVFDNNPDTSCVTPCSLPLAPGRHTAEITLAGYRTQLRILEPGQTQLSIALERMAGLVFVSSEPAGATIVVNGERRSEVTPARLSLPAGKHTVAVVRDGFPQASQEIDVRDGALLDLDFRLSR